MADRIVALTGNDTTGTGSLAAPYRTVKKALTVSSPGDTVFVRDIPNGPTIKYAAENLDAGCSGLVGNPKVVKPYPGERPTFVGMNKFGDNATSKSNYVHVIGSDDCRIDPTADTIIYENGTNSQHAVEIYCTGVVLRGCIIDKLDSYLGSCVALGWNGSTGHARAIDCKVTHCLIRGVGTDPALGSSSSGHDHGLYLNYTLNNEVAYNVIVDIQGGWGIHCYTESGSARHVDGSNLHHNTIVDTRDGGITIGSDGASTTQNTTIDDNLCVDCGDPALTKTSVSFEYFWGGPTGTGNTGADNHSHNPADGHVRTPLNVGVTYTGLTTGDPLFIDRAGGDYRLNPSSPALGKGALGAGTVDPTPPASGSGSSARGAVARGALLQGASADLAPPEDPGGALGEIVLLDYEAPNGTEVLYRARALHYYADAPAASAWVEEEVTWSSTAWWIKNPHLPGLNLELPGSPDGGMLSYPEVSRRARQGVHQALGATLPIVVRDTRGGPTGTIVVQLRTDEERAALKALIDSTGVLLVQGPADAGHPDRYVVVGDHTSRRPVDKAWERRTHETLPWIELASPPGPLVVE